MATIQRVLVLGSLLVLGLVSGSEPRAGDTELGTHGFAKSGDVGIHYVTRGSGPLVILIHGFPDFWYTWRHQMPALARKYQVVAIDQRGYNESDKPVGVENYRMEKLIADVEAVIRHFGREKAILVGHDWGGAVAWSFAMAHPGRVERLVILNVPHPHGLQRELANNPEQQKNSAYARQFQQPDAASKLTADSLAAWVKDPAAKAKYREAFRRSSFEGMLNYYKANYPQPPYVAPTKEPAKVKCPVLLIHGLKDRYLLASGLNDTWKWVDNEFTLVTIPTADHFVQHDAAEVVTRKLMAWLAAE